MIDLVPIKTYGMHPLIIQQQQHCPTDVNFNYMHEELIDDDDWFSHQSYFHQILSRMIFKPVWLITFFLESNNLVIFYSFNLVLGIY